MRNLRWLALPLASAMPLVALAQARDSVNRLPEPETLALLAIGAVAFAVARWRRRK